MSLVTTTQAVKQIHADCFVIEVADIKGEVSFFYRMRLDATAGACLAFLCAFRTLIALLSLQYSLNHLIIIIIIFVTVQKSKRLLCTGVIIMNVQVSTKLI